MNESRSGNARRALAATLVSLPAVAGTAEAQDDTAGPGRAGSYIGAFAGPGSVAVRMTDIDGFTGSNGVPGPDVRVRRHRTRGRRGGGAILPLGERAVPARGGRDVRRPAGGRFGVFVAAGASMAGISNSFTDLDEGADGRPRVDPDDSFNERPTRVGWVAGVGIETPVAGAWTLRFEGLYNDFGETVHRAENRLGVNAGACGPAGLPSPCRYAFDERFALLRLALVRRLDG